jgi:hypothetical protein
MACQSKRSFRFTKAGFNLPNFLQQDWIWEEKYPERITGKEQQREAGNGFHKGLLGTRWC